MKTHLNFFGHSSQEAELEFIIGQITVVSYPVCCIKFIFFSLGFLGGGFFFCFFFEDHSILNLTFFDHSIQFFVYFMALWVVFRYLHFTSSASLSVLPVKLWAWFLRTILVALHQLLLQLVVPSSCQAVIKWKPNRSIQYPFLSLSIPLGLTSLSFWSLAVLEMSQKSWAAAVCKRRGGLRWSSPTPIITPSPYTIPVATLGESKAK